MNIIAQLAPYIGTGSLSILCAMYVVRAYVHSKEEEAMAKVAAAREKLKEDHIKMVEDLKARYVNFATCNKYVVRYNTTVGDTIFTTKDVITLPGDTAKAASLKRELTFQVKNENGLKDCHIVRITHVNEYNDYTFQAKDKEEPESVPVYEDSRLRLLGVTA